MTSELSLDWLISVDDHILEPPHLWVDRVAAKDRDKAPHQVIDNGIEYWVYDGNRYPDLFVSNYQGVNRLYRNDRDGTFTDIAVELGVEGPGASFLSWFWDANNDGYLDLLVNGSQPVAMTGDAPAISEEAA